MKPRATGVKQLDDVLGGGLTEGCTYLVYGPPFSGKDLLTRLFGLRGLAEGEPVIFVVTDDTASKVRERLARLDEHVPDYEAEGLLWFVDAYSSSVGAAESLDNAEYVDSPTDLNALTSGVNAVLQRVAPKHDHHRLVLDSASTLTAYTNPQAVFRFLQVLTGKAELAGGTVAILLEAGMHEPNEVQTVKHLVDGVLELRSDDDGDDGLRLEGFGGPIENTWIEYRFDDQTFEITGSLGEGRIH